VKNTVEMISRGTSVHATMHHHILARHTSFRFNVPSERITVVPKTIKRKNQADMTKAENSLYINGIQNLINAGRYGPLVAIHGDMSHRMHTMSGPIGTQRFLPWHRVYLFELEQMLLAINPNSFIPYWDWTEDQNVPDWLQNFSPTVFVDGNPITVIRDPGQQGAPPLPTKKEVTNLRTINKFTDFTGSFGGLEDLHNRVHGWVGGTMDDIMISPADPLFWLHHANVDRIWSIWQKDHPDQNPNLTSTDTILDPWSFNEQDTRGLANFGYVYV
jgi:tyrosinase